MTNTISEPNQFLVIGIPDGSAAFQSTGLYVQSEPRIARLEAP